MPRLLWIPVTLLGLGAIGYLSLRHGATTDGCAECEANKVGEKVLRAEATLPVDKPMPPARDAVLPQVSCGPPAKLSDDEAPDFSGIGIELVQTRQIEKLPPREDLVPMVEVRAQILRQLVNSFPEGYGRREGKALLALGAIPEALDTLEQRAALWSQLLGAWYDVETETLFRAREESDVMPKEFALGQAYAFLAREHADWLKKGTGTASTDAWLARESLMAGDASLICALHDANPAFRGSRKTRIDLGMDGEKPKRDFLRELEFVVFAAGRNFAGALHHLGQFDQVDAAYERPPMATSELLDAGLYFAENQFQPKTADWKDMTWAQHDPFWDDTLGELAAGVWLAQQIPQGTAEKAVSGWRGDRWLAFDAGDGVRGHVVWQTFWKDKESAHQFFAALQQYAQAKYPQTPGHGSGFSGGWIWTESGRTVVLAHTDGGLGVLCVDAAGEETALALHKKFVVR